MAVKLTVCGGGVLGSQIAYQAAYVGMDVTVWLRSEGSIGRAQPKIDRGPNGCGCRAGSRPNVKPTR